MALLTVFRHRFYKNDGTLNAGGKVYTYVAGTSTPVATYTDSTAATPNANPIILDSKGEADIWVSSQIKVNVLESDDTQVTGWPVDNIGSGVSSTDVSMRYSGVASGTANALTISPSPSITAYAVGQTFLFKAGAAGNSGATTIAISGLAPIAAQSNGAACVGGEIVANYWYTGLIDTLTTCQIVSAGSEGGKVSLTGNQSIAGVKTFSDTTDASSSTVGGTIVSGGLAVAKKIKSGTDVGGATLSATTGVAVGGATAGAGGVAFPSTAVAVADVNTLDDYREASYTGTLTGGTTSPTGTISFVRVGNKVTLEIPGSVFQVTSNATTMTITGGPTTMRPSSARTCLCVGNDNSAALASPVLARIETSGTITLFKDNLTNAWTSSGTKGLYECNFSYIL